MHDVSAEVEAALGPDRELDSALRRTLQSLDRARAEIEATVQQEYELMRYASHELRTPLSSALTNLEVLARELDDDRVVLARAAIESIARMSRLTDGLLVLSRASSRRTQARVLVDLAEVLGDVAGELRPIAADHQLSLHTESAVVHGVRDDLHRLVLNLVENALRHTPMGTHVEMRTTARDGLAVIIVEDDGPGIAPELQHRAFERFARGEHNDTIGSGLGLAIVRAVAEAHGGTARLERAAGRRGARFVVTLPSDECQA
ncbi:MAG TPA: HAMP domain-containing sensor histidine kinase [Solirubrobacteraceae bacterium]|nr:HAMP domain-containing sensor histidine kinase [Solirubrobacteraceae bacterium]